MKHSKHLYTVYTIHQQYFMSLCFIKNVDIFFYFTNNQNVLQISKINQLTIYFKLRKIN
jgi:hypothetical protein